MVTVLTERSGVKTRVAIGDCTVEEAMRFAKANSQTVIPVVRGELVHPSLLLKEGDELELVSVVYGG